MVTYSLQDNATDSSTRFGRIYPWIIVGLGALFYCYEYYLRIAPSVMTQDLMRAFSISSVSLGNLIACYYYAYTPMQLPVGLLLDKYGPRRLLILAVLSCVVGSYLFVGTSSLAIAELGRFLVGFGSAFAFVGALQLAAIWLPPERFALISGSVTTLGMMGAIIGDISLTYLVQQVGWQHTIRYAGGAGVVLIALMILLLRDKKGGVVETTSTITWFEGFRGLRDILFKPGIWINGLIGCLLYTPTSAFAELWGIPYLQRAHGLSSAQAASGVAVLFLGWAIGGPLAGLLSDSLRLRRSILPIGGVLASIFVMILLYVPNLSHFAVYTILLFFGMSASVQVIVFAIGKEISARHHAGTALAITNMIVMLGGAFFQPFIGYLLQISGDAIHWHGVYLYSTSDYRLALTILPAGLILASILAFLLPETRCQSFEEMVSLEECKPAHQIYR